MTHALIAKMGSDRNSIGLYVFIHTSHRYVLHRYCCYEDSTK